MSDLVLKKYFFDCIVLLRVQQMMRFSDGTLEGSKYDFQNNYVTESGVFLPLYREFLPSLEFYNGGLIDVIDRRIFKNIVYFWSI